MTNWKQNPLHRGTMAWCQCSNNNGQVFVQGYLIYDAPLPNHHSQLLCAKIFGRQPSANREMGRKEKLQNNFLLIFTHQSILKQEKLNQLWRLKSFPQTAFAFFKIIFFHLNERPNISLKQFSHSISIKIQFLAFLPINLLVPYRVRLFQTIDSEKSPPYFLQNTDEPSISILRS